MTSVVSAYSGSTSARCHIESRSGPALYVHFRAAVGCLAGLVRLVSADVRDGADVNAWLVPLPFQGMVFEHLAGETFLR